MSSTIVFLGPSLDPETARRLLPGALFLPPAQCGDLLRVLRMNPRAIVLIDGLFEQRPAVWHKEIALTLERGVPVLGAASMGALRAAEMWPVGMLGVGWIFEQFRDGALMDDDEVAVVQGADGEALSDAMVNVRATVARAVEAKIVSGHSARRFLAQAKAVFYAERSLFDLVSRDPELVPLEAWIREHGVVDIKRQDAMAALVLARGFDETAWPSPPPVATPRTTFLRCALRLASCSPLHSPSPGLPERERVLLAARYLGSTYVQTKELALLRAALRDLVSQDDVTSLDELEATLLDSTRPDDVAAHVRWLVRLDIGRYELFVRAHFRERVPDTAPGQGAFLARPQARDGRASGSERGRDREREPSAATVPLLARAWRLVDLAFESAGIDADAESLKRWAIAYRVRHGLSTPQSMTAFLGENGLDAREWVEMVRMAALAQRAGHDLHLTTFFARDADERSHWLEQALRETGHWEAAERILDDPRRAILPRTSLEALERDFVFGEDRAEAELAELTGRRRLAATGA
ncbi:MAG: hypothetical protein HYY06_25835 [Deltaproteobacteria bacterium]|nr:hypothetical protein [Deltaproteobacteria bacterium]